MADQNETVILNFEVDQGQAVKDLERTESAILDLKKEQQNLNKEYKAGTISQQQYVSQNLKLQQQIKKESDTKRTLNKLIETESNSRNAVKSRISELVKEYDNLNTATEEGIKREKELANELKFLNEQITKSSKNAGLFKDQIGNYPQAFGQAASQIRVAGVSVADMGSKLAALATPAGAIVGIVGALGAAYSRSTLGAKDLAFAQNQVSIAFGLASNQLAAFITSAEDGEGAVTGLLNRILTFVDEFPPFFIPRAILKQLGIDIGEIQEKSKELALFAEQLDDLAREELQIRADVSERLEENQELLTIIGDEQATINERLAASDKINENLIANQKQLVDVKQRQLDVITQQLEADENNEDLQTRQLEVIREVAKIQSDTEKKIQANRRVQDNLNQLLAEELRLRRLVLELDERRRTGADTGLTDINAGRLGIATADDNPVTSADQAQAEATKELIEGRLAEEQGLSDARIEINRNLNDIILKHNKQAYEEDLKNKKAIDEAKIAADKATVAASAQLAGEASELFEESTGAYKVLASAQTLISTYLAAQKAFEALAGIPFVGPGLGAAAAGIAIAQGLQRVATINGVEFFEGGYTGAGHPRQAAGVVHRDEYVTPSKVVHRPEAQPHLQALERMRGGYFDGGFVANQNTSQAQQALLMTNALRNMPAPVVSVVEINRGQKRVSVRETQARI